MWRRLIDLVEGVWGILPALMVTGGTPWFVTVLAGGLTALPDGGCAACFFGVVAPWVCEVWPEGLGTLVCWAFCRGAPKNKTERERR